MLNDGSLEATDLFWDSTRATHPSAQCPATHQELEAWEQFNPTKVGMGMLKDCYKWERLLGIEMITENERYIEIQ